MTHLKLFANCIPVKGATRSIICDLQRSTYHFIPNDLHEILRRAESESVAEIKSGFAPEDRETIDEYLQFIVSQQYGFFCDKEELDVFPPIDLSYHFPGEISNAIIDVDESSHHDFESIFNQLASLGCKDIEIRFFSVFRILEIESILEKLKDTRLRSVELVLQYTQGITEKLLVSLCRKHLKIVRIIVSNSGRTKKIDTDIDQETKILFTEQVIRDVSCCGHIDSSYFTVNVQAFSEAVNHNSCLNRKLSISQSGEIKNCPSLPHSYGNIKDTPLKKALEHPDFKALWAIRKDDIEVCKDCEFRYICSDCRAYVEEGIHSKPSKCSYDPYTATWKKYEEIKT